MNISKNGMRVVNLHTTNTHATPMQNDKAIFPCLACNGQKPSKGDDVTSENKTFDISYYHALR